MLCFLLIQWKAGLAGNEKTIVLQGNTVTLTGDVTGSGTFDLNGNLNINTQASAAIALADHNHNLDYLKLTGGIITGSLQVNDAFLAKKNIIASKQINFETEYDIGTVSSSVVVDWNNGNNQKITLSGNAVLTFTNMGIGHKQLKIIQDATGNRVPTIPTGKWPGGIVGTFLLVLML